MKQKSTLLNSIVNYCNDNNLVIWSESKSGYYNLFDSRFYIGTNANFLDYKKYTEYSYKKLKKDDSPNYEKYVISPYHKWNDSKQKNELAVSVFWDTSKEEFKKFSSCYFIRTKIDLTICLAYKNKDYPAGFKNNSVYSEGKNWRNFLECLNEKDLSKSLGDTESINNFFEVVANFDNYFWHACLNYLTEKTTLSEDSQVNISYKIKELFKENKMLLDCYSKRFPFLKALLEEEFESNMFLQKDNLYIENIYIKKNEVLHYFKNYKASAEELIELTKNVFSFIQTSEQLRKLGLDNLDIVETKSFFDSFSCYNCYITSSNKNKINQKTIVSLYKNCMNLLLQNKDMIFKNINANKNIKDIVDAVIFKDIMESNLSIKPPSKLMKI